MAAYSKIVDCLLSVYETVGASELTGFDSVYTLRSVPGTNKKIQGWAWDEMSWPTAPELEHSSFIPMLYDPSLSVAATEDWQSGVGGDGDLLLADIKSASASGVDKWFPSLAPGYFYLNQDEFFLYGEGLESIHCGSVLDSGNFRYTKLPSFPRPTVPIRVYNYEYDTWSTKTRLCTLFTKKNTFTPIARSGVLLETVDEGGNLIHENIDVTLPEFIVSYLDGVDETPTIILNGSHQLHNRYDVACSGVDDNLEIVGESDGSEGQVFFTTYSPVSSSDTVRVFSYSSPSSPVEWTVVSGINPSLSGSAMECIFDADVGSITFGNYQSITGLGAGAIPAYGSKIAVQYSGTMWIDYEEDSCEYVHMSDSDVNTLNGASPKGFVHVRNDLDDPASVTISADLPVIETNLYGPMYIGQTSAKLTATVTNSDGALLEKQSVRFDIISDVGSFGLRANSIEAITDYNGEAFAFYNPPTDISSLGDVTSGVVVSGSYSLLTFPALELPPEGSDIYLFQVMRENEILGIPESRMTDFGYYEDYFDEEFISYVSLTKEASEEALYRTANGLLIPATYEPSDLVTGAKRAVLFLDPFAIHPESGNLEAWSLLTPESAEAVASGLLLTYNATLPEVTVSGDIKSYMAIGARDVEFVASVYSQAARRRIYSEPVKLRLAVPPAMNGMYLVDDFNSIPSGLLQRSKTNEEFATFFSSTVYDGEFLDSTYELMYDEEKLHLGDGVFETAEDWFERCHRLDNALLGLEPVSLSELATTSGTSLPLGFRLRSTGLTVASALNGVVFLNPNATIY